jgi:tellurite resistance protein TehA-like permease
VSIDVAQAGMGALARTLLGINAAVFVWLLVLSSLRLIRFRRELVAEFVNPARGAGFLTLVAATCILGNQCLSVVSAPGLAHVLAAAGALLWITLVYLFFAATITRRVKPGFARSINGGWLVTVVATQALSTLAIALSAQMTPGRTALLFTGLCLYLLGAALYLLIITLVVYRLVFFPLRALEFTPPYWINMGALAITTLAGSLFVVSVPASGTLTDLTPFVKGFSLFFWATASWWIPLLLVLEIWRHGWRHVPLRYEADDWDIVFPLGMYAVGTRTLAHALGMDFLLVIPRVGVYVSLLAWAMVMLALLRHITSGGRRTAP